MNDSIEDLKLKINQRDNAITAQEKVITNRDSKIMGLEKTLKQSLTLSANMEELMVNTTKHG